MPFGNEEEAVDQLLAEAQARARVVADRERGSLRGAAADAMQTAPIKTIALAAMAGLIVGALWKL